MSSGGGGGVLDEAERGLRATGRKWKQDWSRELVRGLTAGHYDPKTGKWSYGWGLQGLDEGVGALSGRNKARVANRETQRQIDAEKVRRKTEADNALAAKYREDLQASRSAQGVRDSVMRSSTSRGQKLGIDNKDEELLGL